MSNNGAVIEFLLNQLRQQLTNNPYKQQCEGLAHEVLSLKNQLRDAWALVAELQEEIMKLNGELRHESEQAKAYRSDALCFQSQVEDLVSRLNESPEQSGCRKNDTQYNAWRPHYGTRQPVPDGTMVFIRYRNGEQPKTSVDAKNRLWVWDGTYSDIVEYKIDTQGCKHEWSRYIVHPHHKICLVCGVKQ